MRPGVVAAVVLAMGCARSPVTERSRTTAETVAWDAPAIVVHGSGRHVVRDGPVAASFSGDGFDVLLGARASVGFDWRLIGARPVAPTPQHPMPGRVHDLRGDSAAWRVNEPNYGRLVYPEVYPGVRLTLESRRHGLAYRFDVSPGGDASAIGMRYGGAEEILVRDDGRALRIRVGGAWLREDGLRCFQDVDGGRRVEVSCRYSTRGHGHVAIALGPYDRDRPLVIDPELEWGSYLGGGNTDEARGVAVDSAGNVYVVGNASSPDFPATGAFDSTLGGSLDAFVAKIAAGGGALEWAAFLGGSSDEHGNGVAIDASGNVYVTGDTESTDFPVPGGYDTTHAGVEDAFVAKVSSAGALLWSTYLGGVQPDEGRAIAVDSSGNAYVTGHTLSSGFPAFGAFDRTLSGGDDAFVTKVSSSGASLVWSSFLGGDSDDAGNAIAVDSNGDVYLAGRTISLNFPTTGGFDTSLADNAEAFVTKVAADGTLVWSSFLGGTGSDEGRGVAVDGAGAVYVTGQTGSTDFPVAGGFDTEVEELGLDAFLVKVDPSGASLAWGSYLGGSGVDSGRAVIVDDTGAAYLTGDTESDDFPATEAFDQTLGGAADAFVAKVDPAGSALTWASYVGGSKSESGRALARTPDGNVVVVGRTPSDDFPTTGGFDTVLGGSSDAFVALIAVCGNGICESSEDQCGCPDDCGADTCGNGCCGALENECDCPQDCGPACGDGCCGPTEDACGCADDCGADVCGNGCCGDGETACDCPEDCGADECGNGCCGPTETTCDCPDDCGVDECNNGCCGPNESACTCPDDCEHVCGDGCCRSGETCENCEDDCGPCLEEFEPEDPSACSCALGARQGDGTPWWSLAAAVWLASRRRRRASSR